MIDFSITLPEIGISIGLYMTVIFIMALLRRDNSIVDIAWGLGFVMIAAYSLIQSGSADLRKIIVTVLVMLWGFRLSYHILQRNTGKGEDFRYKAWRETWKFFILRSYFQIFMLQGLFMLVISFPVWFINFNTGGLIGLWDMMGLFVFGAGFLIEAIADYQLAVFRTEPANRGKLITTGLWSLSRHPNYFGESLVWLGISLYALSLPMGWITLISPLVILLLLRFVSGVPMLEKKMEKYPGWEEYKSRTPAMIPGLPWF